MCFGFIYFFIFNSLAFLGKYVRGMFMLVLCVGFSNYYMCYVV